MKKLLLLVFSILMISCTAEELPDNIQLKDPHVGKYLIEWESNQVNPYMNITVRRNGIDEVINNITEHKYEIILHDSDLLMIGINYAETAPRPEIYLAISRYKDMSYEGLYTPDALDLLYEKETETNAFGYNGMVNCLTK